MRRREFIMHGGAAMAASPLWRAAAFAQQPAMPVVGSLQGVSAAALQDRIAGFHRGLGEAGFVEGRNVAIEYRWAEGQLDRTPWMAADLIGRRVAVIFAGGNTSGVRALIAATQIPIVFTTSTDPVASGLVGSLSRPGGHATGVTNFGGELGPKRLELLHEVVPAAKKIAVLVNRDNRVVSEADIRDAQSAAPRLGLEVIVVNGTTESEIEAALASVVQQGAGALLIGADGVLGSRRGHIAALALRHKLPTMAGSRENVAAGILMGYGANQVEMYRQAGVYVGRILKGEKPGDLPVMQPTKFELAVNLKTAKAIGLNIPESFLLRADEVIE